MPHPEDTIIRANQDIERLGRLILNLQGRIESLESRLEAVVQVLEREHRPR